MSGYITDERTHRELVAIWTRLGRIEWLCQWMAERIGGEDDKLVAIRREIEESAKEAEVSLGQKFEKMKGELMSQISDKINALGSAVDSATARVQQDVATLQQKIADLQAVVDAGGASQADLDALDALKARVDQIDPTTPSVITP